MRDLRGIYAVILPAALNAPDMQFLFDGINQHSPRDRSLSYSYQMTSQNLSSTNSENGPGHVLSFVAAWCEDTEDLELESGIQLRGTCAHDLFLFVTANFKSKQLPQALESWRMYKAPSKWSP
jgi:hypothetical protein